MYEKQYHAVLNFSVHYQLIIKLSLYITVIMIYFMQKHSPKLFSLLQRVKNEVKFSDGHLNILKCFLNPSNMINEAEIPNPLNPNTEMLELTRSGTVRRKIPTGKVDKEDPVWKFFNPEHDGEYHVCYTSLLSTCVVCRSIRY